ncbi:MAG: BolA family transcriptional regulator [Rhodobacterales bacterium]|nr:BolA family transcriptional regulator [Rhodobacterales bacterium]
MEEVIIQNDQNRSNSHAGFAEGGESHFQIKIVWKGFETLSLIARHRAVHEALGKDLLNEIHALALELTSE